MANDGTDDWCTVNQRSRFFSHRRDGVSGRMAACIWLSSANLGRKLTYRPVDKKTLKGKQRDTTSPEFWTQAATQFQQTLVDNWSKAASALPWSSSMAAMAPSNFLAFNAEAQKKRWTPRAKSIARAWPTWCTTCARAMCP